MIVKIVGYNELIFVDVTECHCAYVICDTEAIYTDVREKLCAKGAEDYCDPTPWGSNIKNKKLKKISYLRNNQEMKKGTAILTGDAYLLGDTGKTIEKI